MSKKILARFSNSGKYYARVDLDGKLRVWDVLTNSLRQEYTPDVHLTSPLNELKWISLAKQVKSKKRKLSETWEFGENDALVLGTKSGTLIIYSVASGNVIRMIKNAHKNCVNSVCWNRNANQLFSIGEDQRVIEWNVEDYIMKRSWKCERATCIAVSHNGEHFISAKKQLHWWDISIGGEERVVKTFAGHPTDVHSLEFAKMHGENYVLSAAYNNRLIHAWRLSDCDDNQAFVTFNTTDFVTGISVLDFELSTNACNTATSVVDKIKILSTTKAGVLQAFSYASSGMVKKKPMKPDLTVQVAAECDEGNPAQIPICDVAYIADQSANIVFGGDGFFSFEKLNLSTNDKPNMYLIREDPKRGIKKSQVQAIRIVQSSKVSNNVQYVHSEAINGVVPKREADGKKDAKQTDVPLELRIDNLSVDEAPSSASTQSLVHLLMQGLRGNDKKILQDALLNKDDAVVHATVLELPLETLIPLSTQLIAMLKFGKQVDYNSAVKWLKCILYTRTAHLIANPDVTEIFAPLFPIIESKLSVVGPLYRLSGRLDLFLEQMKCKTNNADGTIKPVSMQPKLVYQDEDSEDISDVMGNGSSPSPINSDDGWEETSEIEDEAETSLHPSGDLEMLEDDF